MFGVGIEILQNIDQLYEQVPGSALDGGIWHQLTPPAYATALK
jgi:hypothetical protein